MLDNNSITSYQQDEEIAPENEFYSDYFLRYGNSYMCKLCPHIAPGHSVFAAHVASVHKEVRIYQCKFCAREFFAEYKCVNHIKNSHLEELKKSGGRCFKEYCHTVDQTFDRQSRRNKSSLNTTKNISHTASNNRNGICVTSKQEDEALLSDEDGNEIEVGKLRPYYDVLDDEEVAECKVDVLHNQDEEAEDEVTFDKPEDWEECKDPQSDVDEEEQEEVEDEQTRDEEMLDEDGPALETLSSHNSPDNIDDELLEGNYEISILEEEPNEMQQIDDDDDDIIEVPNPNAVSTVGSSQQQPLFDQFIFQNIADFTDTEVIPLHNEPVVVAPKKAKKKLPKLTPLSSHGKPSFSYSQLIYLAFKNSYDNFLFVSQIYLFIMDHFPHFKTAPNTWKNSIRHTLCGSKCFLKSTNSCASDLGVGSKHRKNMYWTLSPQQNTIDKMEAEIDKVISRNFREISGCMTNPENLQSLQSGLMKKRYAHNYGPDVELNDGASSSTNTELMFESEIAYPLDDGESTLRIDSAYSTAPVMSQPLSMNDFSSSHEFSLLDSGMDIGYQNVEMDANNTYLYYVYQ